MAKYGRTPKDLIKWLKNKQLVINADSGLKNWRNAQNRLNNGENTIFNINFIGDSITDGIGSGTTCAQIDQNSFVGLLRTKLQNKYGDTGFGFVNTMLHTGGSPITDGPTWAFSGGILGDYNLSYGVDTMCWRSTTVGDTATLNFNGNGIVILTSAWTNGASFNYSIDGGNAVTVTPYSSTNNQCYPTVISGLSDGDHSIVITKLNTASFYLIGAYPLKGTKGMRINNMGKRGAVVYYATVAGALPSEFSYWGPVLSVLTYSANDYIGSTNVASFKSSMQTLITEAKKYGDVLLLPIGLNPTSYSPPLSSYVNAMKDLAISNNCVFIDMYRKWGADWTYAKNMMSFYSSDVHPTIAGHADIANTILKVIN